jgi:hypothetical protein
MQTSPAADTNPAASAQLDKTWVEVLAYHMFQEDWQATVLTMDLPLEKLLPVFAEALSETPRRSDEAGVVWRRETKIRSYYRDRVCQFIQALELKGGRLAAPPARKLQNELREIMTIPAQAAYTL